MNPRRPEMADIVRTHHHEFLARWNSVLSREQRKALRDIRDCRSAALGGRVQQCDRCGHRVILYNSCRNRHCPKCQAHARARWLAQRETELLPVPYFHVVFTLPALIGRLALQNAKQIYSILFRTAAATLLETAAEPRLLGASIGFLAVLHTWGQNLHLHPHLHCVVPRRRHLARWLALDRMPKVFLLPACARAQPPLPEIVPALSAPSLPQGCARSASTARWNLYRNPPSLKPCAKRPPPSIGWFTPADPAGC